MSESESFLARWSRRKQEAERSRVARDAEPVQEPEAEGDQETIRPKEPEAAEEPTIDLSTLPPIDSIGVGTDIRAFLQKGVPLELTRAALRRAWSADPAIRDFIEVAENQWDFATGADIPGFGALDADEHQVRRWVAQITEASKPQDAGSPITGEGGPPPASERPSEEPNDEEQQQAPAALAAPGDIFMRRNSDVPPEQEEAAIGEQDTLRVVRRHGRALPQ